MINAVLVFNNNGQPRLTKFYTQLVCISPYLTIFSSKKRQDTALHNDVFFSFLIAKGCVFWGSAVRYSRTSITLSF